MNLQKQFKAQRKNEESKYVWDRYHMAELPPLNLMFRNVEEAESTRLEPRYDIGPLRLNGRP